MALLGQIGSGIRAGWSTNSGSSWTRIVQIRNGNPFQTEREDVDSTVHGNTSIRTEIPGLATDRKSVV